jgi:DNA (cytosine-5)-methyltransferase 1
MRYLSVCSGIEAASVAWHHLGWEPVGFSEIEPFPAAVLAHRFPSVPNFGDMTKYEQWPLQPGSIDILVGGTPCQSFSVAGLRKGLEDPRGNLMLTYLAIAARLRPRWIVWENVPGVLSSNGGRDFGTFLGALGELGYGFAYRVLDAQYVRVGGWPRAVPQRRRRVFVVGCLGDGAAAAEVLALREGLQRHLEASGKARKGAASDAQGGARGGCYWNGEQVAAALTRKGCDDRMPDKERLFAVLQPTAGTLGNRGLRSHTELDGHGAYIPVAQPVPFTKAKRAQSVTDDETWVQGQVNPTLSLFDQGDTRATTVAVAHAFYSTDGTHGVNQHPEVSPAVKVGSGLGIPSPPAVAHSLRADGFDASEDGTGRGTPLVPVAPSLTATNDPSRSPQSSEVTQQVAAVHASTMIVRRLSPRECERLQGFPDNWTLIPWRGKPAEQCPDGPRYKALRNSMACNCMAWIGEKIAKWEADHA